MREPIRHPDTYLLDRVFDGLGEFELANQGQDIVADRVGDIFHLCARNRRQRRNSDTR